MSASAERSGRCARARAGWLAAWLLGAVSVAGCARSGGEPDVVRFWAMYSEAEAVEALLPDFQRRHPEIRVEIQKLPWSGAHQKLLTAFAADALPDLGQLGNTWVPELAALGALEPLAPWIERSDAIVEADYFPGIWDTNLIDGTLYGVPWYVDTRLLFYRTDLLARAGFPDPPANWAQWRLAMAALKRQAGDQGYAILLPLNEFEPLLALALQQDDALLRDDGGRGNFDSPGFRRALAFYLEMFDQGWAPRVSNTQIANVWSEFGRGYFSFYISGPWNIAEFRKRLPAALQDSWRTAPLPGPDGPGASTAGGSSLVLFRGSPAKRAAWTLLAYLSEPAVQQRFNQLTGNLPARRGAWDDPRLAGDLQAAGFREQLERVRATPKVPEWERIATELKVVAEQAVHGRLDIDAAVLELDRRTDAILEKRRWLLQQPAADAASVSDAQDPSL
jgi:multiple sugar transport system substrate-binding protein